MREKIIILLLFIFNTVFSQEKLVNLSQINFCNLTILDLQKMDPEMKLVAFEQRDFCRENNTEDGSPEIKFGYKNRLFPGVRFYEPKNDEILIPKIHLTTEFKGYLPDGKFVDVKKLYVSNLVNMYTSKIIITPNKCGGYFELIKDEGANFMLKIYKTNKLLDDNSQIINQQQLTQGIDVLFDCYYDSDELKNKPLYVVDGKETKENEFLALNPNKIKAVNVIKDKNAEIKYGKKGRNGVIEVILIK